MKSAKKPLPAFMMKKDAAKKAPMKYAKGGAIKARDGVAQRGKTRGKMC